jgi:pyruvate dehydrogenase complex dehydrogenase (E1) component
MSEESAVVLSRLETPHLNTYRRELAACIADLKAAQQNLNLLVNQNNLDKTPYLLTGQDTSKQERLHASQMAVQALNRVRQAMTSLPS